ncbi:MAG TPA: hypothetical protein VLA89_13225 [Gemmatimonadales bacterium]|nr:hypothetical protein [Gemmatimonadales bacterium]
MAYPPDPVENRGKHPESAEPVETLVERVREALAFHESVIKSGEGYTETVVLHTSEALAALTELEKRLEAAERERDEWAKDMAGENEMVEEARVQRNRQRDRAEAAEARVVVLELNEKDWSAQARRLYERVAALEEALREIADEYEPNTTTRCNEIARAALRVDA